MMDGSTTSAGETCFSLGTSILTPRPSRPQRADLAQRGRHGNSRAFASQQRSLGWRDPSPGRPASRAKRVSARRTAQTCLAGIGGKSPVAARCARRARRRECANTVRILLGRDTRALAARANSADPAQMQQRHRDCCSITAAAADVLVGRLVRLRVRACVLGAVSHGAASDLGFPRYQVLGLERPADAQLQFGGGRRMCSAALLVRGSAVREPTA